MFTAAQRSHVVLECDLPQIIVFTFTNPSHIHYYLLPFSCKIHQTCSARLGGGRCVTLLVLERRTCCIMHAHMTLVTESGRIKTMLLIRKKTISCMYSSLSYLAFSFYCLPRNYFRVTNEANSWTANPESSFTSENEVFVVKISGRFLHRNFCCIAVKQSVQMSVLGHFVAHP